MRLIEDIVCIILLWLLPDWIIKPTKIYDAIVVIANERVKRKDEVEE